MRAISPFSRYSIQIVEGVEQVVVDQRGLATSVVLNKPVIGDFEVSGLLDHEIEAALMRFNFSGLPEGVSPLTKLAVYDTEIAAKQGKWSEEFTKTVEDRLMELSEMHPGEFIVIDVPNHNRPWPSYDEDSVEEILAFQSRLRISPESVRLYEEENGERAVIIEAMLEAQANEAAEIVVTA